MFRAFNHPVVLCSSCDIVFGSNLTNFKLDLTTSNMLQHIATRWPIGSITSRCSEKEPALLPSLFGEKRHERAAEIEPRWPTAHNTLLSTMLRYVVLVRCDRSARDLKAESFPKKFHYFQELFLNFETQFQGAPKLTADYPPPARRFRVMRKTFYTLAT